jgi:tripartite-type tricarboxylate transporter receptor subunit TctC
VKVYGVTSAKRVESLKDIPTLQEQGLKGFEVGIWHGLYAPKGTPKPVVDKLSASLQAARRRPGRDQSASPISARRPPIRQKATSAALQAHVKAEIAKWGRSSRAAASSPTSRGDATQSTTRRR